MSAQWTVPLCRERSAQYNAGITQRKTICSSKNGYILEFKIGSLTMKAGRLRRIMQQISIRTTESRIDLSFEACAMCASHRNTYAQIRLN